MFSKTAVRREWWAHSHLLCPLVQSRGEMRRNSTFTLVSFLLGQSAALWRFLHASSFPVIHWSHPLLMIPHTCLYILQSETWNRAGTDVSPAKGLAGGAHPNYSNHCVILASGSHLGLSVLLHTHQTPGLILTHSGWVLKNERAVRLQKRGWAGGEPKSRETWVRDGPGHVIANGSPRTWVVWRISASSLNENNQVCRSSLEAGDNDGYKSGYWQSLKDYLGGTRLPGKGEETKKPAKMLE